VLRVQTIHLSDIWQGTANAGAFAPQNTFIFSQVLWHPHAMITAFKQHGKRQVTCWRSCPLVSRAAQLFLITGVKVNYPESAGVPEYFFCRGGSSVHGFIGD